MNRTCSPFAQCTASDRELDRCLASGRSAHWGSTLRSRFLTQRGTGKVVDTAAFPAPGHRGKVSRCRRWRAVSRRDRDWPAIWPSCTWAMVDTAPICTAPPAVGRTGHVDTPAHRTDPGSGKRNSPCPNPWQNPRDRTCGTRRRHNASVRRIPRPIASHFDCRAAPRRSHPHTSNRVRVSHPGTGWHQSRRSFGIEVRVQMILPELSLFATPSALNAGRP